MCILMLGYLQRQYPTSWEWFINTFRARYIACAPECWSRPTLMACRESIYEIGYATLWILEVYTVIVELYSVPEFVKSHTTQSLYNLVSKHNILNVAYVIPTFPLAVIKSRFSFATKNVPLSATSISEGLTSNTLFNTGRIVSPTDL